MVQFPSNKKKLIPSFLIVAFVLSVLTFSVILADHSKAAQQVNMKTGQGKEMILTFKTLPNSRDYIYCELVISYGDIGSDIYSTSPIKKCSVEWWDNLDLEAVAKELGAKTAIKNGPQSWSMDEVGVMVSKPVTIAGVEMNFGAHLPAGTMTIPKYTVFNPAKYQNLVWKAGRPTYQLVDPDGYVYVLQGYKVKKEDLATLGSKFKELPKGWKYQVVSPSEDLIMNLTPAHAIPSVQDEFDQIYIRIPK